MAEKSLLIQIRPMGGLGNRMIQYMAALKLRALCGGGEISNVILTEWGIHIPPSLTEEQVQAGGPSVLFWNDHLDIEDVAALCRQGLYRTVIVADWMQRTENFLEPAFYNQIFRPRIGEVETFGKNQLVINIRADEIKRGVSHYPLVPRQFYQKLVEETGLQPVFMGQVQDGLYGDDLRKHFPNAIFIQSRGVLQDFEMIRRAPNIVASVSTFSWLAAWMSGAQTVFLPLLGFLQPCFMRNIDLLPLNDSRYRFFAFPLFYGLPEREALTFYDASNPRGKEITAAAVRILKEDTPFLRMTAPPVPIETWYVHRYQERLRRLRMDGMRGRLSIT